MNVFIAKALRMVAQLNANNTHAGIDTFSDLGIDFNLLLSHEEDLYEAMLEECLEKGFNESFRLNTIVLDRAISALDKRM